MIDLHSHILPALDDGPSSLEGSFAMAREAVASGTRTMVATPHIRADHDVDPYSLARRVHDLQEELRGAGLDLRLLAAGEVAITKLADLDDDTLALLRLGEGRHLLVESPYTQAVTPLEAILFDLRTRGFESLLAHPERCPLFHSDPGLLRRLVDAGALCSLTAGSLAGRFGDRVRAFSLRLLREGLVHDVSSDCHDAEARSPHLLPGFEAAERDFPGLLDQAPWYLEEAPAAILADEPLPRRPAPPAPRRRRFGLFR